LGHVARTRDEICKQRSEVQRLFRRIVVDETNNIKTNLTKIGSEGVDWIHLANDIDQWWLL